MEESNKAFHIIKNEDWVKTIVDQIEFSVIQQNEKIYLLYGDSFQYIYLILSNSNYILYVFCTIFNFFLSFFNI